MATELRTDGGSGICVGKLGGMLASPPPGSAVCFARYAAAVGVDEQREFRYRYVWARCWNENRPLALWVMLNPSTANELQTDRTVDKCVGFTERTEEQLGGLVIVNLFAHVATRPAELRQVDDPVGPENDEWIRRILASGRIGKLVVAWGKLRRDFQKRRRDAVARLLREAGIPICQIGALKNGDPRHPSRAPYGPLRPCQAGVDGSMPQSGRGSQK